MTEPVHDDTKELARLLRVMADETRLRILGLLAERSHHGREIAEALDLTPPTVSHHMRKLVDADLVIATSEAQRQNYALNTQQLAGMRRTGASRDSSPAAPDDATEEEVFRARTLRNFFDGDRLKSIPVQRKQRVVVLQYLLRGFQPDRDYPEAEVNAILTRHHEDYATLRREMVDYGFMTRERGTYRVSRSTPQRSVQVAQEFVDDERAWLTSFLASALDRSRS